MASRSWLKVGVVGAVALQVAFLLAACGSDEDAEPGDLTFYRPSTVVDEGKPGELLEESPAVLDPSWPGTGSVIRYLSTTPRGDLVPVTGVLLRPEGDPPPGGFPVVVWAHGTVGLGDPCAPSRAEPFEATGAAEFLRRGYVVVAPDYEGLGVADEVHAYLVGEATGNNILDAARVAETVDGGTDVVVFGVSQGGHATLFSRTLAESYAPELDLLGVVAAAPVTDIATFLAPGLTDPLLFPFTAEAILAWAEVYEETDLEDLVVVADAEAVRLSKSEWCTGDLFPTQPLDEIFRSDPTDLDVWIQAIETNSATVGDPGVPVLLTHGDVDGIVPVEGTLAFHDALCESDEDVTLLRDPTWTHEGAWTEPLPQITEWITQRFDKVPATSDC